MVACLGVHLAVVLGHGDLEGALDDRLELEDSEVAQDEGGGGVEEIRVVGEEAKKRHHRTQVVLLDKLAKGEE